MDIEVFRTYCLGLKGVTEEFPFDETTLVFKVSGKVFALSSLNKGFFNVSLKCEPEQALQLREHYPLCIQAGYHLNKKHWNTISFEYDELSDALICEWTLDSYDLVYKKLTIAQQESLL
jgi:predicted DNA-binding protein (MmcQ/YjbR family)